MIYRFADEVHDFQRFVRQNIRLLGEYVIISEQLYMRNNETGILDMLAVDLSSKKLVILELKNEVTTDKNIWQPIRYYDLARRGEDSFKELLKNYISKIDFPIDEIDLIPKLVLVVPKCNEQLLRTLSYFNDIESEVIELTKEITNLGTNINKKNYYPKSVFHKEDLVDVQTKISKDWDFNEYAQCGINKDKISLAKKILETIKLVFNQKGYTFDVFYSETKVTITKNGKVWSHLFIKQRPLDFKLTMSFKIQKDVVINVNDFTYNPSIESKEIRKNGVKLTIINTISSELLAKYI